MSSFTPIKEPNSKQQKSGDQPLHSGQPQHTAQNLGRSTEQAYQITPTANSKTAATFNLGRFRPVEWYKGAQPDPPTTGQPAKLQATRPISIQSLLTKPANHAHPSSPSVATYAPRATALLEAAAPPSRAISAPPQQLSPGLNVPQSTGMARSGSNQSYLLHAAAEPQFGKNLSDRKVISDDYNFAEFITPETSGSVNNRNRPRWLYQCNKCQKDLSKVIQDQARAHYLLYHSKYTYKCPHCIYRSVSLKLMGDHIRAPQKAHDSKAYAECPCGHQILQKKHASKHYTSCAKAPPNWKEDALREKEEAAAGRTRAKQGKSS